MPDGLEQANQAFTAVINSEPGRGGKGQGDSSGPPERVFRSVGDLEVDEESPAKGGGDDDPEEAVYGNKDKGSKADPRNPRKSDEEDSESDDDESDGDDSSGDEDDSDGDESADDAAEAESLKRKVEVTVDGEPVEVTLKEALEGYVRTETFHRRMNQLDEAKKIVRRAATDAVQNYEYSVALAKEMEAYMETMVPKEPNWDEEFQKDPARARELQRYHEKANTFRNQLKAQMSEISQKQMASNQAQLAAFAEEESSKFEQMNRKNWSDPKKKMKDLQSMRRTGITAGFSEDELSQVYDSRMLTVLLKASKFDRMMASRPQPVQKQQIKQVSSGTGSARQRKSESTTTAAMKRLNRTGSLEDAAVVFDQIIRRG